MQIPNNIWIQLIGIAGTVLYFVSFQCKSNRNLFRMQFLSYLTYTLHFLLLGAITGGLSYILNTARSFCMSTKNKFLKSWWMCAILCVLQVAVLAVTWAGWKSLLPVCANIATTIGAYTNNAKKIRLSALCINSPLWIIYDVIVGSWAGILDELFSAVSMIISGIRFGWKNMDDINE